MVWKTLKVGDRVRLTNIPSEFLQEAYYIHEETLRVYQQLLLRGRPLRVYEIDEYGSPWIRCRFKTKSGRWQWECLAINHSGLVKCEQRTNKKVADSVS